jgi:hypothetical protein
MLVRAGESILQTKRIKLASVRWNDGPYRHHAPSQPHIPEVVGFVARDDLVRYA